MHVLAALDLVWLCRVQFALTLMFHYIFPPLTIGMSVVLAYLEGRFLWTKDPMYETAAKFWTKIFALNFAMGVATGIVMEFQFGTNWAAYSRFVGDVFGSALAAEGVFAFFLESGFLSLLVFGWDRVSAPVHFFATLMVAIGGIFSSVWITVANSWQQTPAGHHVVQMMRDGKPWFINGHPVMRAEMTDWFAMVLNHSSIHRLIHVWLAAFILGAFFIMSVAAWYILRRRHEDFARHSFRGALWLATLSSIAILFSGDLQAKNVYRYQPAKLAAFEGQFHTGPGTLSLFGVPDEKHGELLHVLGIPGMLGYLLYDDWNAPVIGLDKFRPQYRPPVAVPFYSYHIMVALGMFFIVLTLAASLLLWRKKLFQQRWLMWVFVFAVLGPFAGNELGWVAAEVGRQPWTVYPPMPRTPDGKLIYDSEGYIAIDPHQGLLTKDSVSESVQPQQVLGSIIGFGVVYTLLFVLWIYLLDSKIRTGPEPVHMPAHTTGRGIIDAASARTVHHESMTENKEPPEAPS